MECGECFVGGVGGVEVLGFGSVRRCWFWLCGVYVAGWVGWGVGGEVRWLPSWDMRV